MNDAAETAENIEHPLSANNPTVSGDSDSDTTLVDKAPLSPLAASSESEKLKDKNLVSAGVSNTTATPTTTTTLTATTTTASPAVIEAETLTNNPLPDSEMTSQPVSYKTLFSYNDEDNAVSIDDPIAVASDSGKSNQAYSASEKVMPHALELMSVKKSEAPKVKTDESNIQSIADINRLNEQAPTAAGIPVKTALSVENKISKLSLPAMQKGTDRQKNYAEIIKLFKPQPKLNGARMATELPFYWSVGQSYSDENNRMVCSLNSPTIQLESPDYTSQVWYEIKHDRLYVFSTMNLDPTLPNVGVQLDSGPLLGFNDAIFANNILWAGDLSQAIGQNNVLRLYLGGNELGKEVQETFISLKALKRDYEEYRACERKVAMQAQR